MLIRNARAALVIPGVAEKKQDHDGRTDDSGRDHEPRQEGDHQA
jgi:hypothetical protein